MGILIILSQNIKYNLYYNIFENSYIRIRTVFDGDGDGNGGVGDGCV